MTFLVEYNSYLRSVTDEDLELIYKWRNKPNIRKYMFNEKKIEWQSHLKWFSSIINDDNNKIKLFIENNEPRGIVQINRIDIVHETAEWGFYIGDSYKKGLGTLLAYHGLRYIFEDLSIRKLNAQVLSTNLTSLKFHEKIGFNQEGILQSQISREQELIDVYLYALFNDNWKNIKIKLLEDYSK